MIMIMMMIMMMIPNDVTTDWNVIFVIPDNANAISLITGFPLIVTDVKLVHFQKAFLPNDDSNSDDSNVFKMIVMGQSISAIGEQLSLNVNTISTYRSRIMEKMNMKTNADLVKYAILNSII
jgi:DNA-binding CsgD family transcriptional regulator